LGELIGIPEWLAKTTFVLAVLAICVTSGIVLQRRGWARLAVKRPNPTQDEFLELISDSVSLHTAEWLWNVALPYYGSLTPHPDDHLAKDAMIDDDDWGMDWPRDFADYSGFSEKSYPDWPPDWPATIRNFGRWLDLGRAASSEC
jgi:hypothetical protein